MNPRSTDCKPDALTTTSLDAQKDRHIHAILNLVEPNSWKIEKFAVPWQAAEEKLSEFQKVFLHEISINNFRVHVENVLQNFHNHAISSIIKKAKSIRLQILLL